MPLVQILPLCIRMSPLHLGSLRRKKRCRAPERVFQVLYDQAIRRQFPTCLSSLMALTFVHQDSHKLLNEVGSSQGRKFSVRVVRWSDFNDVYSHNVQS